MYRPGADPTRVRGDSPSDLSLVDRVLLARGFDEPARREKFLSPNLRDLHDPSLIPDLDRAAERLLRAARDGERIIIYGDYDVDGVTATSILWHTLRAVAPRADIGTYVPHRVDEGYGLSGGALRELAANRARVVVSVDCGVTAVEPARAAREAGLDLIITDHHNPPASIAELPTAFAVVHPRRPDSAYPFGELCGAGVAYKLAWRVCTLASGGERVTADLRALLLELLAFATLGTIADVVPLVDENRAIARAGLSRIKHSSFVGLRALVNASGLAGENVNAEDVGFKLGPRLNAVGRLGHAREAVELFTTADAARAAALAAELTRLNDERRRTEHAILEEAKQLAATAGMTSPDRRAIVLASENWHAGVVGIVCSRLVELYSRPTILLAGSGEHWHGSGRSVEGFALADALRDCASHLISHGGHDMAAGMKLDRAALGGFVDRFTEIANRAIAPEDLAPRITIDTDSSIGELTADAVRGLERLAPFGPGNSRVRLRLRSVRVAAAPRAFGSTGKHLELRVRCEQTRRELRLVGWNLMERLASVAPGSRVDAIVTPKVSDWNGTIEPEVHDVRPSDA